MNTAYYTGSGIHIKESHKGLLHKDLGITNYYQMKFDVPGWTCKENTKNVGFICDDMAINVGEIKRRESGARSMLGVSEHQEKRFYMDEAKPLTIAFKWIEEISPGGWGNMIENWRNAGFLPVIKMDMCAVEMFKV